MNNYLVTVSFNFARVAELQVTFVVVLTPQEHYGPCCSNIVAILEQD